MFVIAMTGLALWWVTDREDKTVKLLAILALIVTSVMSTDLDPRWLRETIWRPYILKVAPLVAAWFVLYYRIWRDALKSNPT